jgi:hypothetical protein
MPFRILSTVDSIPHTGILHRPGRFVKGLGAEAGGSIAPHGNSLT